MIEIISETRKRNVAKPGLKYSKSAV